MRRLSVAVSMLLVGFGLLGLLLGSTVRPVSAQDGRPSVEIVSARGIINPSLAHYLVRAIDQAETDGAMALVLEMDTPGGLDTSVRQIIQRILA